MWESNARSCEPSAFTETVALGCNLVGRAIITSLLIAALVMLLLVELTQAAPAVRIRQGAGQKMGCWSGTVIGRLPDKRLAVLTCSHGYNAAEAVSVEVEPDTWAAGTIVVLDKKKDLGLIGAKYDLKSKCFDLATEAPKARDILTTMGYPHGESLRALNTRCAGEWWGWTLMHAEIIPGESGGTVLRDGKVCGVILGNKLPTFCDWSTKGRAVTWSDTTEFLAKHMKSPKSAEKNPEPLALLGESEEGSGASKPVKPTLYVFGFNACLQCNKFGKDLKAGKLKAVEDRYTIEKVDPTKSDKGSRELAKTYGLNKDSKFPLFIVADKSWSFSGYQNSETFLAKMEPHLVQPYRRAPLVDLEDVEIAGTDGSPAAPPPGINVEVNVPVLPAANAGSDWSDVTVVILVREGALGGPVATAAELAKKLGKNPRDVLPVGEVENMLAEHSGGKAGLRVVTQRFSPRAYAEFYGATRLEEKGIGIIALVKSKDIGLMKSMVANVVERIAGAKLLIGTDRITFGPIFERTDSTKYAAAIAALSATEIASPVPSDPGSVSAAGDSAEKPDSDTKVGWMHALLAFLGVSDGGLTGLIGKLFGKKKEPVPA